MTRNTIFKTGRELVLPKICILGSTGSIGRQALEVINALGPPYEIVGLSARNSYKKLEEQCRLYRPKQVALNNTEDAALLKENLGDLGVEVLTGDEGISSLAGDTEADLVLVATVGFSGLLPTLSALKSGKKVALANKESLVVGGELLSREIPQFREMVIPVDSEHSAIYQCLLGQNKEKVKKITLTASGGPFKNLYTEQLKEATPAQALKHPNWSMGPRITIDSATLMNKGFEVLEASWLFGLELERIEVMIHPQSVIHSMVEFVDGTVLAQMGTPDMRVPIQYALTHPDREPNDFPALDLLKHQLTFEPPDKERFPCLDLAYQAGKAGGTSAACLNAADEVAVDLFLKGVIRFNDIPRYIELTLKEHENVEEPSVDDIIEADWEARNRLVKTVARLG